MMANWIESTKPSCSVVVPVFDEEGNLHQFYRRITAVLAGISRDYEIVFVDDGSRDQSPAIMDGFQARDTHVKVLHLSRNFGHQIAVTAGLDVVEMEVVVVIDADLQDPPELIPELVARWRDGHDVVYAVRERREGESAFKRATAYLFYRILLSLSSTPIPLDTGDFRLLSRRAVDELCRLREHHRFVRGMVSWIGFRQTGVPYVREVRFSGKSHYPLRKMVSFAVSGITSFSFAPLRLAIWFGLLVSSSSLLLAGYFVWLRLFTDRTVPGWTSLIVIVLLLGGTQLVVLGLLGEYVGRIHEEVKQRPLYIVDRKLGFAIDSAETETRKTTGMVG